MPIAKQRQKELRQAALHIVWQIIDAATREVDLMGVADYNDLTDDEANFIYKIIDSKAQAAFCEYQNYKERRKDHEQRKQSETSGS